MEIIRKELESTADEKNRLFSSKLVPFKEKKKQHQNEME
jgi:hypothetical protein